MKKELDKSISTLGNFRNATKGLSGKMQLYIQAGGGGFVDSSVLVEVTEIQMNLPKNNDDSQYLILRCR